MMPDPAASTPPSAVIAAIDTRVEAQRTGLIELSHAIHRDPELGFEEHRAAARVSEYLTAQGFDSSIGAFGLETALVSRSGTGGPVIAFLAEYDALPGIGHACGHNIICATSVGAYTAAARQIAELGGTAVLYTTPAEENGTGKELMARAGAFDGVDAAVMVHPQSAGDVLTYDALGLREVSVVFHGKSAHASAAPELGLNALDAAVTAYQSISQFRQSLLSSERVHGVISDGGTSPNVIPDRAALHYYLRAATPERLRDLTFRVQEIFEAAALATGTTAEVTWDPYPPCLPVRNNMTMAKRFGAHFERLGRNVALASESRTGVGSTDLGNVSLRVPSIHPMVGIDAPGVGRHTEEFVAHAASPRGDATVIDAAKALASVAVELVADPAFLTRVRDEFAAAGGAVDVPALLRTPAQHA